MICSYFLKSALILACCGATISCSLGGDPQPGDPAVIRRDSAGIRIVESSSPLWEVGREWKTDSIPDLVIGSTDHLSGGLADSTNPASERIPLQNVQGISVLSDGRIVVADQGSFQVMVFDAQGGLVSRFGGQGEGPGELPRIYGTRTCGSDSIVVVSSRTIHIFDDQGRFQRRASFFSPGQGRSLIGVSSDCRSVLVGRNTDVPSIGETGIIRSTFEWIDPEGRTVERVADAGLVEVWTTTLYGVARPSILPWGTQRTTHAEQRDQLVVGNGRVPELFTYDSSGLLTSIFRWSPDPVPVTQQDRRNYVAARLDWFEGKPEDPEIEYLFPELDAFPEIPSTKPIFDRVLVDGESRIWVRALSEESLGAFDLRFPIFRTSEQQRWTVFDSEGVWLGSMTLPIRFDLRAVAADRLFGVSFDSFDVQTVQVFRILRP